MTILRVTWVVGFLLFCCHGFASQPTRKLPPFGIDLSSQFVSAPALQPVMIKIVIYADHPIDHGTMDVIVSVLESEEEDNDKDVHKPMRGSLKDADITKVWIGGRHQSFRLDDTDKINSPKIEGTRFQKALSFDVRFLKTGRYQVSVLASDGPKKAFLTVYIEAGPKVVYGSPQSFWDTEYDGYIKQLPEEEILSKKALRRGFNYRPSQCSGATCPTVFSLDDSALVGAERNLPYATVREAVEASGGVYQVINDGQSARDFADAVSAAGLTNSDQPSGNIQPGMVDFQGQTFSADQTVSYPFYGPQGIAFDVAVESAFSPRVCVFDNTGGILGCNSPQGGDALSVQLPYTGKYVLEFYAANGQFGDFKARFQLQ